MHLLVVLADEAKVPLIMPNWAFAGIAALIFFALGFLTWTQRDVFNRHYNKASAGGHDDHEHGHAGHQGHTPDEH